ncbi:hypothetical protein B9J93_11155 [Vibrio sp. V17_P4S1T151]|uniref:hypothetical protein n=1 Tax=unclassified Vibrio TaxID=2614977 RepID=UPI000B8E4DCB|nr:MULTISPECIES: hypothetical protein [unclassified Vibrio]OXX45437.1 hypothetical protein B9J93_11155 [Vibrio sp. V17_P4S1T151]OXX65127.1 hypothetical protein B9J89_04370 [Vibrio sp. V15_P4S5T153]
MPECNQQISMKSLAFWDTPKKDVDEAQKKMDSITKSLSSEQVKTLEELIEWITTEVEHTTVYDREPN